MPPSLQLNTRGIGHVLLLMRSPTQRRLLSVPWRWVVNSDLIPSMDLTVMCVNLCVCLPSTHSSLERGRTNRTKGLKVGKLPAARWYH